MTSELNTQRHLREGIDALRRGNRVRSRELLLKVVRQNNGIEEAWWWLSQAVDDPQDQMIALQNVLVLNPNHAEAQKQLTQLRLSQTGQLKTQAASAAPTVAGRRVAAGDQWKSYLPETPLEADDGVDDPLQCVYCGLHTELDSRRCPHCGRDLYRRVKKSGGSGFSRLLLLMLGIAFALGLVEALGPVFALSAAEGNAPTGTFGFDLMLQVFGVEPLLGNFLRLPPPLAQRLLIIYLIRLGVMVLLFFGLFERWTLAYYGTILAALADLGLSFYLLINGYLGVVGSLANLILGLVILSLIFASSFEFAVNTERMVVRPDTAARSALDFYRRGHEYRQQGMWALAVAQWRRAVGLAPKVVEYYKDLGVGYAQIKRFDRSLRVLTEAQRQAPRDPDIPKMIELVQARIAENTVPRQ